MDVYQLRIASRDLIGPFDLSLLPPPVHTQAVMLYLITRPEKKIKIR